MRSSIIGIATTWSRIESCLSELRIDSWVVSVDISRVDLLFAAISPMNYHHIVMETNSKVLAKDRYLNTAYAPWTIVIV